MEDDVVYISTLRVIDTIIAYEDEGYPDLRLASEIAQSVDVGQIEVHIVPPARIPAVATTIKVAAIDRSAPEQPIEVPFGVVPIPEKQLGIGCVTQVEWSIDHPGFGVIGIVSTTGKATTVCPAAYAPTAIGARVRPATAPSPIVFAVASKAIKHIPRARETPLEVFGHDGSPTSHIS